MSYVKIFRYASSRDADKKKTPVPIDGDVFSKIIPGKVVDGVGWIGDKDHLNDVTIGFKDGSSIVITMAPDLCPSITFIPK
jgi:hypothetical protein